MQGKEPACETALRRFAAGEFEDWAGLPSTCSPADLSAALEGGEVEAMGRLSSVPTRFRTYRTAQHPEDIQAWFDDKGQILLITLVAPSIAGDVQALLDRLGPPAKRLEQGAGYHADSRQWIYADRGLTLYVREHLGEIARVAVYPATTVDHYEQRLGARDKNRYLPWDAAR